MKKTVFLLLLSGGLFANSEDYVSFSDFVGSADFANVATISAAITGSTAGADLTISEVGTTSIPEPTTIAIFGLALVGFAFSSKRKA